MKTNQKGFAPLLLLIIPVLLIFGVVAWKIEPYELVALRDFSAERGYITEDPLIEISGEKP